MTQPYLAHYGVLGMHWGIRRYQPYSTTGPRKGGKTGKEIGEAKDDSPKDQTQSSSNKKALKIALGVAAVAGAGVGLYFAYKHGAINKISDVIKQNHSKVDNNVIDKAKTIMKDQLAEISYFGEADEVRDIASKGIALKSGQQFNRIEFKPGFDPNANRKGTYVSYLKEDSNKYLLGLKNFSGNDTDPKYQLTLEAIKDIKAPDKKTATDIFNKLWNNDPTYRKELERSVTDIYIKALKKQFPESYKTDKDKLIAMAKGRASIELKNDPFSAQILALASRGTDTSRFYKELEYAGFNAIEDYHDKDTFTKSPLIIFNAANTTRLLGEKKVDELMTSKALRDLLLSGRKK